MYGIDVLSGEYGQVDGDWSGTRTLVGVGDHVYAITAAGSIYAIDPRARTWSQVGDSSSWKSRLSCTVSGKLYTLEDSGTFYEVTV